MLVVNRVGDPIFPYFAGPPCASTIGGLGGGRLQGCQDIFFSVLDVTQLHLPQGSNAQAHLLSMALISNYTIFIYIILLTNAFSKFITTTGTIC